MKYYVSTEEIFSEIETSDEDAELTVESFKGMGNDVVTLSSKDADTESDLTVMDVYGVEREISLKGSSVSVEMTSDREMMVTVSEDAKEVKVDGEPLAVEDNKANVSFVASEGANPMQVSDLLCDVSLDDKDRLSGTAEAYLTWSKMADDVVDVITKFKDEEGNVVAEYQKKETFKFGKQKVNISLNKVKTNMGDLSGEFGVVCEMKLVDSKGQVVRISQENLMLKTAQAENPSATPEPGATSTPKPVVTSTPDPTATSTPTVTSTPAPTSVVTPSPDASQQPDVTKQPESTKKPTTTKKPVTTKKPKAKASLPKKGKVIASGSLKYIVVKSAKKNGKVAVYGAKNKNASKIVIPKKVKLKGYTFKVTGIYRNAFKNMKKLSDVTIGVNVTSIGNNAFQNCRKMKFIIIPQRVTKIGGKPLLAVQI